MIKIYQKTVRDIRMRTIKQIKVGSWVYVTRPTEEEIKQLVEELKLEEDLIRDGLDPYEVPRLEVKDEIVYIFTRFPHHNNNEILTSPVLIAIGPDFVVTLSKENTDFLDKFIQKTKKGVMKDFSTTQKTKLVLLILHEINSCYTNFLTKIHKQVKSAQVRLEHITNKNIVQLVGFEGTLNDFLSALQPTNEILQTLLSGKIIKLYEKDKDITEDLLLSNGQLIGACKSRLKMMTNIRETYSTIMTNDLNRVIRLLTVITILFTIPNIISSFYGMNISLPFAESPLAFAGIIITILVVSIILLLIFHKNKWL
ncbi:MAG: magnesium transporter CorA family protein [Candidatus Pacebacteria bacterium]|nr:magnesium transporter CorA family protein [Candidatus Paceibacterota bacterium]